MDGHADGEPQPSPALNLATARRARDSSPTGLARAGHQEGGLLLQAGCSVSKRTRGLAPKARPGTARCGKARLGPARPSKAQSASKLLPNSSRRVARSLAAGTGLGRCPLPLSRRSSEAPPQARGRQPERLGSRVPRAPRGSFSFKLN